MSELVELKVAVDLYRSALLLNNMAVCLLRRGLPNKALKTINESLHVLQQSFHFNQNKDHAILLERIERAKSRFSETSGKGKALLIEINELEDSDLSSLQAASKYGPSFSVFFPVRIGLEGTPDATESVKHLTIVLYNQGMILFAVALSSPQAGMENGSDKLLCAATKSLELADKAIARQEEDSSAATRQDLISMWLLKILVLNNLSAVYRSQNLEAKVDTIRLSVSSLTLRVEHLKNRMDFVTHQER